MSFSVSTLAEEKAHPPVNGRKGKSSGCGDGVFAVTLTPDASPYSAPIFFGTLTVFYRSLAFFRMLSILQTEQGSFH